MIASCGSNCSCNGRVFKVNQFIAQIEENRLCRPNNQSGIVQESANRFSAPSWSYSLPRFFQRLSTGCATEPVGRGATSHESGTEAALEEGLAVGSPLPMLVTATGSKLAASAAGKANENGPGSA